MMICRSCHSTTRQVKHGCNPAGRQRSLCQGCTRTYLHAAAARLWLRRGHAAAGAAGLYADGLNLRRSARHGGVLHQTVAPWVAAHADALPAPPPHPEAPGESAARDELYTFVGPKKTPAPA